MKKIKLPKNYKPKTNNFPGKELMGTEFFNAFLCAHKNSGKTVIIYNLLKQISKGCSIILFCPTHNHDDMWKAIKEEFDMVCYDDLEDLDDVIEFIKEETEDQFEEKEMQKEVLPGVITMSQITTKKLKKKPKFCLVFDDLSSALRNKSLNTLIKKGRHLNCKIIFSSQYVKDLMPETRENIEMFIMFRDMPEEDLNLVRKEMGGAISKEEFKNLYDHCTMEKYSCMSVNKYNGQIRKKLKDIIFERDSL